MLAAKADVNAKNNVGYTALMIASQNGHLEVVQALLAAKADANAKMADNVTALIYASQNGHLEVVRALLAAEADVNAQAANGRTALIQASQDDHLEVVRALLAARADVNAKMANGVTALFIASQDGYLELLQALLASMADVNAKRSDGYTALMIASQNSHLDVVQALLAARADVNAKTIGGGTALIAASYHGHVDVVRALLAANADVNAKMANGLTAEAIAAQNGHPEVMRALKAPPLPPPDGTLKEEESGARKIMLGAFTLKIPSEWTPYQGAEKAALTQSVQAQSKEMYLHYSGVADPTSTLELAAYHTLDGGTFVAIVYRIPPQVDLMGDLRKEAPEKAKWGIERGFIRSASPITPVARDGFEGFYLETESSSGSHDFSGGLVESSHKTDLIQVSFVGSKRPTENELSDFSQLWHDGCGKTIIEAQDVDRNHSSEV